MIHNTKTSVYSDKGGQQHGNLSSFPPNELLFGYLENPHESIIIIDAEGLVRFVNKTYEKAYSKKREEVIGRLITDVSPKSRLLEVLKTGKVIIYRSKVLKDTGSIVFLIPLKEGGKIIGAVGKVIFIPLPKLKQLYARITTLENKLDNYKEELQYAWRSRYSLENIIGNSLLIKKAKSLAEKAAQMEAPVLIVGESGTGKELFAHAIHSLSRRNKGGFVKVNCSCIPTELIESEFFGYSRGAFSGANKKGRIGKFELADEGTIFLDEIGDMPINLQPKFLRVLQEKEIEKVGGNRPKKVDFRLISATNQHLSKTVQKGKFRLDLFHRINVIKIDVPALRQIQEDIPLLVKHFFVEFNKEIGMRRNKNSISSEAMTALTNYSWPGNVRELRNALEKAIFLSDGDKIELENLPIEIQKVFLSGAVIRGESSYLKDIVGEAEEEAIREALKITENNRGDTAKFLGIHRTGLYKKMRKYGIS